MRKGGFRRKAWDWAKQNVFDTGNSQDEQSLSQAEQPANNTLRLMQMKGVTAAKMAFEVSLTTSP